MLFYLLAIGIIVFIIIQYRRSLWLTPSPQKFIFISGCDSGFGNLAAKRLGRMGCTVLAGCLTKDAIKSLQAEKLPIVPFEFDISKQESIDRAVEIINHHCKDHGLWAVINNAGIGRFGVIDLLDFDVFREVLEINFFGHVSITKALLPLLKKTKGRVINTASAIGRGVAGYGKTPYICSKRAMEAFNDCLRLELNPWGIKVIVIEPGYTNTNILPTAKNSWVELEKRLPKEKREEYGEVYFNDIKKWFGRVDPSQIGKPEPVVNAYVHAALAQHPKQRYMVGTDTWLIYSWLPLLPSWLSDEITKRLEAFPLPSFARK